MTVAEFIIALLIIFLAAVYLYYIGTVLIQALKVGILKANAEIKMKIEEHQENLRQRKALFESRYKALPGLGEEKEKKIRKEDEKESEEPDFNFAPLREGKIISMQINFGQEYASNIENILKRIKGVKRHVVVGNSAFIDIDATSQTPANIVAMLKSKGINILSARVISGEKEKERIDSYELEI